MAQWPAASVALIRVSGRHWVRHGGQGGRKALIERLDGAVKAIPASLDLSASGTP
jgi:hypothetical protein